MLNIIIVSDDLDSDIGPNCTLSHSHFNNQVDLSGANTVHLGGDRSTAEEIQNAITSFNGQRFIVIAYTHGCEDKLTTSVAPDGYVNVANSYFFGSSIIYTNSCYSGIKLKHSLIESDCLGYVGYTDAVYLPENDDDVMHFISCESSGLVHFLNSTDTLSVSMDMMEQTYRKQYKSFLNRKMNAVAALLMHNFNSLTFFDAGGYTRSELEY